MKKGIRALLLPLGDILMLLGAFFAMLKLSFWGNISRELIRIHSFPFAVIGIVWIFIFFLFNLYDTQSVKPTIPNLRTIGIAAIVSLATSAILFYSIPSFGITPKTNLLLFGFVFILFFILWRRLFYGIFASNFKKGVAFVVNSEKDSVYVKELVQYIENYPQSGFSVDGIYGSLSELFNKNIKKIDTLIVSKNALNGENLKPIYGIAHNILGLAYAYEDILGKVPVDSIDETWFLHNVQNSSKFTYEMLTQFVNFVLALCILIIASPFLVITAICIKLEDGGTIFYNHFRTGKNGDRFKLYKFRTMVMSADKGGLEWTEKEDPRITKVGKIIRRLHVDEIPQLLNVLKGEMALVGPRPELPSFVEKLEQEIPHYSLRHIITPGWTGWAQIKWRNARGIAESKQKFEYDLYYIKNRNIFMDLGIILRTIIIIFTHDA